jgi:hypothetical protein
MRTMIDASMIPPGEKGAAMLMALAALALLSAFGVAVLLTSSSEMLIAGAFRDQRSGVYAADAFVVRAFGELAAMPGWGPLLDGATSASLVDGPPSGSRTLPDGTSIDLAQVVNMATCQKAAACTASEMDAVTAQRPWGPNNPRWQLYAYGPLRSMLPPGVADAPWYVVLLVADDPLHDADVIALRAEAFGPRGAHAATERLVMRSASGDPDYNGTGGEARMRILSWREVR